MSHSPGSISSPHPSLPTPSTAPFIANLYTGNLRPVQSIVYTFSSPPSSFSILKPGRPPAMLPLIVQAATSILIASSLARAQIVEVGQTCNLARNRLTSTTHQFLSDCVPRAFCDPATSTCKPKGCRRDEFPFKFPPDTPETPLPPLCPEDQFCPDEGDQCLPLVPVGQNCQINRDGQ